MTQVPHNNSNVFYNDKSLGLLSDREVQELQTIYLREIKDNSDTSLMETTRIRRNIVFFFWLFWVSVALSLLILEFTDK